MYAAGSGPALIPIVRQAGSLGTPQWTCVLGALWLHPYVYSPLHQRAHQIGPALFPGGAYFFLMQF